MTQSGDMQKVWQGESDSVEATLTLGRRLATCLQAGDVLALDGELGAGKTQLVRGLAVGLGVKTGSVASPTFVMVHEYQPDPAMATGDKPGARVPGVVLVHIDAYRLRSLDELETLGWSSHETDSNDALAELRRGAVVVIEWADKVRGQLGDDVLSIRLQHVGEQERQIDITAGGSWFGRIITLQQALADGQKMEGDHHCPICKATVAAGAEHFPFCGKRCRMVDLGKWLGGDYRISRPVEQRDLEEGVD